MTLRHVRGKSGVGRPNPLDPTGGIGASAAGGDQSSPAASVPAVPAMVVVASSILPGAVTYPPGGPRLCGASGE